MFKRIVILLLILCIGIILIGCGNLNETSIKTDKLKFNIEIGNSISNKFGVLFIDTVNYLIQWYNSYIDEATYEELNILTERVNDLITEDMIELAELDLLSDFEKDICRELLNISGQILFRQSKDILIEKEEFLRERNLKDLSDAKFEALKAQKEEDLKLIKESIMDILNKYFIY